MSDVRYDSDTLRNGGQRHRESADRAGSAAHRLAGLSVSGGLFGKVGMAGAFAGALAQAHQEQTAGLRAAVTDREGQGRRADGAAGLGDGLTSATTAAASAGARSVAAGME